MRGEGRGREQNERRGKREGENSSEMKEGKLTNRDISKTLTDM